MSANNNELLVVTQCHIDFEEFKYKLSLKAEFYP